jgi:drug/metabolite transporter (DMT)-like permease
VRVNDILILLIMTMLGAMGAFLFKKSHEDGKKRFLLLNLHVLAGGTAYFLSSIINIYLLRSYDYTTILPATSITYVWTAILGRIYFSEPLSLKKLFGIFLLIIGILFLV